MALPSGCPELEASMLLIVHMQPWSEKDWRTYLARVLLPDSTGISSLIAPNEEYPD